MRGPDPLGEPVDQAGKALALGAQGEVGAGCRLGVAGHQRVGDHPCPALGRRGGELVDLGRIQPHAGLGCPGRASRARAAAAAGGRRRV